MDGHQYESTLPARWYLVIVARYPYEGGTAWMPLVKGNTPANVDDS